MKKRVLLPLVAAIAAAGPMSASAQSDAATIAELEKRIKKLEKQQKRENRRVKAVRQQLADSAQKFRINGFFQAGFASMDTESGQGWLQTQNQAAYIDDEPRAESETMAGLQMSFKINDRAEFQTQLVSRGGDDFKPETEWAFIKYELTNDLTVRAGRLRTPFFQLSEFMEVGYAYPWVRAPLDVYGATISSYNGIDVLYKKRLAGINFTGMAYYGGDNSESNGILIDLADIAGVRFGMNYSDFTFSIGYGSGKLNLGGFDDVNEIAAEIYPSIYGIAAEAGQAAFVSAWDEIYAGEPDSRAEFGSIALAYDNGKLNLRAEAIKQRVPGLFQDDEGHYISAAYRVGSFTPYAFYSKVYTTDDGEREKQLDNALATLANWSAFSSAAETNLGLAVAANAATAQQILQYAGVQQLNAGISDFSNGLSGLYSYSGEQTSAAIGTRWDFASNMALKVEYMKIMDIEDSPRFEAAGGNPGDSADVYSVVINAVF